MYSAARRGTGAFWVFGQNIHLSYGALFDKNDRAPPQEIADAASGYYRYNK